MRRRCRPPARIRAPRRASARKALSAQGPEKVGDRGAVRAQRLDAGDLRGEEATLGVEHVKLARDAVLVAQPREAQAFVQRGDARRFGVVALAGAQLDDERGAHLAEGVADRLLVLLERGALECFCLVLAGGQSPALEDRLRQPRGDLPGRGRAAGEQVGERRAFATEEGREEIGRASCRESGWMWEAVEIV